MSVEPFDPEHIRLTFGAADWRPPTLADPVTHGWIMQRADGTGSVIVSLGEFAGSAWIHASLAWRDRMPTYAELTTLRDAVFGSRWALQVFAPPSRHVNIHEYALHLWGRLDGARVHPDFGQWGTI